MDGEDPFSLRKRVHMSSSASVHPTSALLVMAEEGGYSYQSVSPSNLQESLAENQVAPIHSVETNTLPVVTQEGRNEGC